jgi:hypothetical protein
MLTGLESRYTNFCCFECEWDRWATDCHYRIQKSPLRSETTPGQKDVVHSVSGDKSKIYLPPLHIKLGLIKTSVKAMDKESKRFACLRQKFPQ